MSPSPLKVCLSVDVEQDCPPYLDTFRGIEEGIGHVLDLFSQEYVKGTFFVTGEIALAYPEVVRNIVSRGHELGSHGLHHHPFDRLDARTASREIHDSATILRPFSPVVSFRAPNLCFPDIYQRFLPEAGFRVDSSLAKYKPAYFRHTTAADLARVPVSTTSSVLRLPNWVRFPILHALSSPVVLFVHPWEFVDLTRERLRLDCRFRTGPVAVECLKSVIRFFKIRQARFLTIGELALPKERS